MEQETKLEQPLVINMNELDIYCQLATIDIQIIPKEHQLAYELANISLQSKQCNEPYESLLSRVLNLYNNENKHGWDAFDNVENPKEYYEFKPSSKTNSPCGSINDDTFDKIQKYEDIMNENKKTWIILAGINKKTYSFDCIYKFPAEIYTNDRKNYLYQLFEKNKLKEKQTRAASAFPFFAIHSE